MVGDLIMGCAIVAALAAGLFVLTLRATRSSADRTLNLLAILAVCTLGWYIQNVWYDVRLARWLPYAGLIVLGNWLPLFAAVLAAVAWQSAAGSRIRQVILTGAMLATGSYALVYPLLGSAPHCGDKWDKMGTCLQTTKLTCSAACAATLLERHGIGATEQEMAELCLTRCGTSWQGLYRGLKLKTAGTSWDVEIVRCRPDELAQLAERPLILSVGLESGLPADTEFTREFGWVPGVNHSVVLTGFTNSGLAVIADPSIEMSREQWDRPMLATLWRGYAIRLVPRQ
ncbi:MAG: hypothetical protein WEH44_05085 [Pirellulaceae bacterium]